MFISKRHLDRRTFLRGMGATIALPLLDAMVPAGTTLAAATRLVPRMAFVYFPHGAIMSEWTPAAEGRLVQLGRILDPLAPFTDRLTIVSGLENRHAYGPVHAITPGTWLSGAAPPHLSHPTHPSHPPSRLRRFGETGPTQLITADQIAAQHIGRDTPLPSIEVAVEEPRPIAAGAWEGDYSASFGTTVSFRGESTPQPMEFRARHLFDRLFSPGSSADERVLGMATATTILDRVAEDTASLQKRLGPADRARLSDYLESVRDVERRVEKAKPFDDRLHLMFDMIALAFQADITRVASFMMAAETSQMTYDHLGLSDSFHLLSHHQNDPEKLEKLVQIQSYHTRVFASFVRQLSELSDGDGSILDRSLILYGSNMSDSHAHDHFPLPAAIVGGGCGALGGGRHLRYPDRTPLSNLLLTVLHRAGVPVDSIGDSTGACAEI
jgi:Protein of unknown function (DUF1552)